ncbi:putative CBL-interacting protein kinase 30 [Blattamonas nauphoetae]|uniref:non-specific serine/threonine protein kinase n=1 Tax=Blattamonas nauphoetae TaxID=2049346 RepID=A0ABQ9Y716_9EUKA|nr:putative CBL-interacting protein kinase 30 [Blattamonas nauphoetae]
MTSKHDEVIPPGYSKPKILNEGSFGQVLKVTHEGSGVEYAVKVLPMLKEGDKERVSREVEMLTRFAHARIVHLHESIDMGGHQAIVMELGTRSLKDLISEYESRGELIPLPLTVMILTDICEGLLWMHTHPSGSTAHGDLKPENVLLRENNRAFLCDLGGSATLDQQMTSTIGELGTFEYNSPERVMDSKGLATAASDVWSLGVLAYRLVTGQQLFSGVSLLQLGSVLEKFNESRIPTTIPASVRAVLVKMLEPNVALRATASALLEGGLLEGMLGSSTDFSRMKSIQLATVVNEIKESLNDAEVQERTMELSMEKEKLLLETQELEARLRSLQKSLELTRSRTLELEKEEEQEQRQLLLTTPTSPSPTSSEDNVLSTRHEMPDLLFYKDEDGTEDESAHFSVSGDTITRTGVDKDQNWSTTLFEEPILEGVVSVAIKVLAIRKAPDSEEGLMFGLVDALSRVIDRNDQLGDDIPSSIAIAPRKGRIHAKLPSTEQREKTFPTAAQMKEGDRVVLEVDMDARPRTAVFIVNGNVPLTFVSGLPPSIRLGLSMKNEGVSVRFDGMSRLKRATPLRRVNEIKWNPEDLRDRVEDNRIASTGLATKEKKGHIKPTWSSFIFPEPFSEGIIAFSFAYLMDVGYFSTSFFGVIDGTISIPEKGQTMGKMTNSIALSSNARLSFVTPEGRKKISVSSRVETSKPLVLEINMDSNPRTAQFFASGKSANVVVVGLPESVRVGFSTKDPSLQVRFDRITHMNRGSPITDQMKEIEWPVAEPPQATESDEDLDDNDEERTSEEEKDEKDSLDESNIDDNASEEEARREESDEDNDLPSENNPDEAEDKTVDHDGREDDDDKEDEDEDIYNSSERKMENERNKEESDGDSDEDSDEGSDHSESDSANEDDGADVEKKKWQLPAMKLPGLLFTNKTHFIVRNNVLTRTEKGTDKKGRTRPSTVLLSEPITKGVVSITFVVMMIADSVEDEKGFIDFGLLDSCRTIPTLGRGLGKNAKHSIGLSTSSGDLHDRVVMEVNMDSTPRTVQFFVNGEAGKCYVSGIPESVRIGFSADVMGTSLEIASVIHSTQATPLAGKMKEIRWTDTEESLEERNEHKFQPIRREPEGSVPALLTRNPEHFKIEGNVITRTAFDSNGLDSPFSTVMLDGVVDEMIKSVTVTILALPETEHSCGVVMIGGLWVHKHIPKSPKGLGIEKEWSFGLCSSDGMTCVIQRHGRTKPCHSPLQVGDQVVLEVNTQSKPDISHFFVNGKAGLNGVSDVDNQLMIGFSLAGAGTSIRIDSVTELDEPSQNVTNLTDKSKTNEDNDTTSSHPILSEHMQPATLPKPQQNQSTPQPSASKTDSVQATPTAASSSTSKVPLKPQPLAAKVAARDHPAYEPFFAKLKSGKKAVFLAPEMREKGLNPAALSDPDMLV